MGGIIYCMTAVMQKTCLICNKELVKTNKFCSLICKGKYQSINNRGGNNSNYKGGTSNCKDCSKILSYRYKSNNSRCRECHYKNYKGKEHCRWTGNFINIDGRNRTYCNDCKKPTGDANSLRCQQCTRGRIHHAYKHGLSPLQNLIRNLPENRMWIKDCMRRDNFICHGCGTNPTKDNSLQVHHIKQFALIIKENNIDSIDKAKNCSELWDINNGVTLCIKCHKLTDSFNKQLKK